MVCVGGEQYYRISSVGDKTPLILICGASDYNTVMVDKWQLHCSKLPRFSFFWRHQEVTKLSAGCCMSEWNKCLIRFFFSHCSQVLYMTVSDFSVKTKMGFPLSASTHSRQGVILWNGTKNPPSPVPWGRFGNLSNDISSCANGKASFSSTNLRISPKYMLLAGGQMDYGILVPPHVHAFILSQLFFTTYWPSMVYLVWCELG